VTSTYQRLKEETLRMVSGAPDQRLRPHDAVRTLAHTLGVSTQTVRQAVRDLVDEGTLVYTYRDPTSFLERSERSLPDRPVG